MSAGYDIVDMICMFVAGNTLVLAVNSLLDGDRKWAAFNALLFVFNIGMALS